MVKIAVIGYGVVGSGVVEMISENSGILEENTGHKIEIAKILDIREFPNDKYGHLVTASADEIFNDPDINIVVETMGGTKYAYDYSIKALKSGKHVVTSNKEMVAAHGPELLMTAKQSGVRYMFEASVGGGIPIIRTLSLCLAGNNINEVYGILNGTTNYILTQMKETGKSFEEALAEAQEKGYAEANPAADVEGYDAVRKIAILSSVTYNEFIDYKQLYCEGITKITVDDIKAANEMGYEIKLIGYAKKENGSISAFVSPMLIPRTNMLSEVNDVFNAIMVKGDFIGESMYYGPGAGKNATASAVVGDIIDIVKNPAAASKSIWDKKCEEIMDMKENKHAFFIRYKTKENTYKTLITAEIKESDLETIVDENLDVKNIIRVMKENR